MATMIKVRSLKKSYFLKKREVKAINGISFDIPDKGLIFILGKSGSGKSTLLNLLGALDRPTEGSITVDGKPITDFNDNDFDDYRNKQVGFVFQNFELIENYSAGQNVGLALNLQGNATDREKIDKILRELELTNGNETLFDRKTNELSGGQKQRIAIARALIKDPKLILADEPTGALDSVTAKNLYDLLKKLSEKRTIIVVSHDVESAWKYGDRVIELKDGLIESDSAPYANNDDTKKVDKAPTSRSVALGGLPYKNVFLMGFAGLKHNRIRLTVSIILAVISFTLFGFATAASEVDRVFAELNTAYQYGSKYAVLTAEEEHSTTTCDKNTKYQVTETEIFNSSIFTKESLDLIQEYVPIMPMYINPNWESASNMAYWDTAESKVKYNPYNRLGHYPHIGTLELDPVTGERDAHLTPDPRLTVECRLPQNYSEIALTDFQADMFMRFGLKDVNNDGNDDEYAINSPDDLIGKTVNGLTICGVYKTLEDKDYYKEKYDYDNVDGESFSFGAYSSDILYDEETIGWFYSQHLMKYGIVMKGFFMKDINSTPKCNMLLYPLSANASSDMDMIKNITYSDYEEQLNVTAYSYETGKHFLVDVFKTNKHTATIRSEHSGRVVHGHFLSIPIELFMSNEFRDIAMGISIGVAIFSILLLMNFLSVSLSARIREIGIIRALGASGNDVINVCLAESMIIATINFVCTTAFLFALCFIINASINFSIFNVGLLPIGLVLLLYLGVAVLSTIIPTIRLLAKKPVDIINNRV